MMSTSARHASAAIVAAAALLTSGCAAASGEAAGDAPSGDATLTFVAYGGVGQDAMIEAYQRPFEAAHPNVRFVNTSPPDVSQVKAQVESGQVSWSVIATAPAAAEQNCGTLFEPLDASLITVDTDDLVEGTIGKCYFGNFMNTSPLAYRTDAFPDPDKAPTSIADFFDLERFPGQRGILTMLQNGILEYPLIADGVPADSLYPLDLDRTFAKLDTIRDHTTFAPNVGALQQAVAAGQVDMFFLPDTRLVPLMDEGHDITVVWDVAVSSMNGFAIPKGTPHFDLAQEYVASIVQPAQVTSITEALGAAPVNRAAPLNLSENAKKVEVFGPANTGETVIQDVTWYAEHFNEVTERLTNWVAG